MKYIHLSLIVFLAALLPSIPARASGLFDEERPRHDVFFGIAPGLAFPVTASGGLERTITWAIDVSGRIGGSSLLLNGGYRYINVVKDVSTGSGSGMNAYTYRPYNAVALGIALELSSQRRTVLPMARVAALVPISHSNTFGFETGLLADLYLGGGSLTLEVALVTRFDPIQVMSMPVRLGLRWGM